MQEAIEASRPRIGRPERKSWAGTTCLAGVVVSLGMPCLSGCDKKRDPDNAAASTAPSEKKHEPFRIGVSQANLGEPYRVQMNADIQASAAKHPGLELIFKDAQNDSLRQRAQVEELLSEGIDLLIISPKESAPLTAPVARVHERGIPVVVLDRRVDGDAFTTFIGADNRQIGRAAGRWIAETLHGEGKIVELEGLMTSSPARDRHEGILAGLDRENHPGLDVVFTADTQWLEPNARREMESALASHAKIDLVYAHNDPGAHGAYLAAKAADRQKEMKFVGIDALPHEGQRYVKEGLLDVTFLYPTCGHEAIDAALDIRAGRKLPREITLGTRIFTRDNVARGGEAIE